MGELHDLAVLLTKTECYEKLDQREKNKAQKALEGGVPTTPSSNLAKVIVRLARLDPPNGTPPPVPLSAIDALWKRDGVFVRSLSSFHGDLREAARAAGFSCIYVQMDHSADVQGNRNELAAIGPSLLAQGWKFAGWSTFGQGTDAHEDGRRQAAIKASNPILSGWVANGESWAEGGDADKSAAFLAGWVESGGTGPLAVSCLSSDNPNWARAFDYRSWLAIPGVAVMPQVYGASYPAYTVQNAVSTLQNGGVPRNRLALTFDVIQGAGPFADYRTWTGPRSIWTGDDSTVETWAALKR